MSDLFLWIYRTLLPCTLAGRWRIWEYIRYASCTKYGTSCRCGYSESTTWNESPSIFQEQHFWCWSYCSRWVLMPMYSHLTAFCACNSSPHLPVTPAQLMRPGIGWNMSCTVGDCAYCRLGLPFFQGDVVHWYSHCHLLTMPFPHALCETHYGYVLIANLSHC